jgi:hypothetical protein
MNFFLGQVLIQWRRDIADEGGYQKVESTKAHNCCNGEPDF